MIVVAIIGILAAVAIPGFMRYIKDSKTSEAKTNLKAIADGAIAFYETEHDYLGTGMAPQAHVYPGSKAVGGGVAYEAQTTLTSVGACTNIGVKNTPASAAATLGGEPWNQLKFEIVNPFYYKYSYISAGTAAAPNTVAFGASAVASLDSNADSKFGVSGDSDGKIGNIVDMTENTPDAFIAKDGLACGSGS